MLMLGEILWKNMVQSLKANLKRLKTDYIDLYWIHACNPMTPVEEMMRAVEDIVKSGKILYIQEFRILQLG
jgi:aryl-alcohol dehydrogenase-like predicted oxidoreductase